MAWARAGAGGRNGATNCAAWHARSTSLQRRRQPAARALMLAPFPHAHIPSGWAFAATCLPTHLPNMTPACLVSLLQRKQQHLPPCKLRSAFHRLPYPHHLLPPFPPFTTTPTPLGGCGGGTGWCGHRQFLSRLVDPGLGMGQASGQTQAGRPVPCLFIYPRGLAGGWQLIFSLTPSPGRCFHIPPSPDEP